MTSSSVVGVTVGAGALVTGFDGVCWARTNEKPASQTAEIPTTKIARNRFLENMLLKLLLQTVLDRPVARLCADFVFIRFVLIGKPDLDLAATAVVILIGRFVRDDVL